MLKRFLFGMTAALGGCATAQQDLEPRAAELIIGKWDCRYAKMEAGARYVIGFARNGSLSLYLKGVVDSDYARLEIDVDVTGTYEVEGLKLSGRLDSVDLHLLTIDGEPIGISEYPEYERGIVEIANASTPSAIRVLDDQALVMVDRADGAPISCVRKA